MIFDEIPYDDSNQNENLYENTSHELLLQQLKNLATVQEAKIYSTLNQDWKAQLDPQVRQWMTQVRQQYFETQKKSQKVVSNIQLESFSIDNQTADLQLDDYFQL
ncbi:unnamed protein product (macronuclear) [Paramecium tetraurelia]|uniref:Uncharacterized protein n=1 Tax=Paramecium tetraurelia TaxID=5888 RepID=A0DEN5_PARTE|nr:uncharacterized protein GSPATT00016328001 [Paramecium tetraurelia]CAK81502.1 unnamed protein product [Paramecium tetraurelia]|eukprot:XP_001448899.1 hypothetical protein (macronuclear) [Paramecium tetraurelia strain d4-2]